MVVYKNSSTTKCITEIFIESNRYRKLEKLKFLKNMLHSKAGLFEITKVDMDEGYVYLKDLLSEKEYRIIDIGLSGSLNYEKFYVYMRIISHDNISFGTGLNLLFDKEDSFIQNWIYKHKEKYNLEEETSRFIELYNEYTRDSKGLKTHINSF